jgi:hypothetical protein
MMCSIPDCQGTEEATKKMTPSFLHPPSSFTLTVAREEPLVAPAATGLASARGQAWCHASPRPPHHAEGHLGNLDPMSAPDALATTHLASAHS